MYLLLIGGIILTLGDIILKRWVVDGSTKFYYLGILCYLISANLLALSFKSKNIAIASVTIVIFNVITLTLASYFLFHEEISTTKMIGIILALVSILIMEI